MLVVTRFRVAPEEVEGFLAQARAAVRALAARPGYRQAQLGRCTDDEGAWVLVTHWDGAGAYRRALSAYDVRVAATPLFTRALPEPGAYEVVVGDPPR